MDQSQHPLRAHTAAIVGVSAQALSAEASQTIERIVAQGLEASQDDVTVLLGAAEWYAKLQSPAAAMKILTRALTVEPGNPVAANNLAMLLADQVGDYEQALRHINGVLAQTGPVAEFLDTKGWILLQMKLPGEAIQWLGRAIAEPTPDPLVQFHLAAAYLANGDREQARRYWQAATNRATGRGTAQHQ